MSRLFRLVSTVVYSFFILVMTNSQSTGDLRGREDGPDQAPTTFRTKVRRLLLYILSKVKTTCGDTMWKSVN